MYAFIVKVVPKGLQSVDIGLNLDKLPSTVPLSYAVGSIDLLNTLSSKMLTTSLQNCGMHQENLCPNQAPTCNL